jgi:hypothetical protein
MLDATGRRLRARLAAHARAAAPTYDGAAATAPATAGYWAKLEAEVDPAGQLAPAARRTKARRLWQSRMDAGKLRKRTRQR